MTQRVFIMTGEASGDALAAWYIARRRAQGHDEQFTAVAGAQTAAVGATIHRGIDDLSIVGVAEIIRHLPRILGLMSQLTEHITQEQYDELVLVDYPGFNLRLLKKVRARCPHITITYLSPPQLWVWGAWRVRTLQRYVDRVIVLYPFEVAWYEQRGVRAEWLGSPVVERLDQRLQNLDITVGDERCARQIAFLPGSRRQEITQLMPYYAPVLRDLAAQQKNLHIMVIVAPSLQQQHIEHALTPYEPETWGCRISYVTDRNDALAACANSVCALTKPGTNTLELALLEVPGAVLYKASWITYWLARCVVTVTSMTLPNLLLKQTVYPEFIQTDCQTDAIVAQLRQYLQAYETDHAAYDQVCNQLRMVRAVLTTPLPRSVPSRD